MEDSGYYNGREIIRSSPKTLIMHLMYFRYIHITYIITDYFDAAHFIIFKINSFSVLIDYDSVTMEIPNHMGFLTDLDR